MPNKDGSGPNRQGPRTGRGAGNRNGQGGAGGGGHGRGAGRNHTQGNPWIQNQLSSLQTAIHKLTERLDGTKKE